MGIRSTPWIWHNGKLVPWEEARVHVLIHALHYGSSVFEGIRAYDTPRGPAVLGLEPHVRRLFASCKIYRLAIPYSPEEIARAILDTVRANGLRDCYIRPLVFRGLGTLALDARECPTEVIIATVEMGRYHSVDGIPVGKGERGPVTAHLQEEFFGIVTGRKEDRFGWLTYVEGG